MKRVFLFLLFTIVSFAQSSNLLFDGKSYYYADRILVKFKQTVNYDYNKRAILSDEFYGKIKSYGVKSLEKTFEPLDVNIQEGRELEKIVTIKFDAPFNPIFLSKKFSKLDNVEWAEPQYVQQLAFTPDDPQVSLQYGLTKIQAFEAWDLSTGNPNITIAIIDTGADLDHPDLASELWQNPGETPNNGIDDDNNGYVDDYNGYDFGGSSGVHDSDPQEDAPVHGTHVAGIAAAATNNDEGIASIGYNSKLMIVKCSEGDERFLTGGYQGIIYAADNGADFINCSWGNYSYSLAEQNVIDYATSKGALVIAAAGNDNTSDLFYPASYDKVLSVGGTDKNDVKWGGSNFGDRIDIVAPAFTIYSTWLDNTYKTLSGTSMAAPLAAGLGALVKDQFPDYTPLQIAERIRVTSDLVDTLTNDFEFLMGKGRINAFKALNEVNPISVRIKEYSFIDLGNGDGILDPGENIQLDVTFTNYLSSVSGLTITIQTESEDITISNNSFSQSSASTLQDFSNSSSRYSFQIIPEVATNQSVKLKFEYTGSNGYTDFEWLTFRVNPTYAIQSGNNISFTATSNGTIGFNDYPNNVEGNGFIFRGGTNLLFEGALMYGTAVDKVVDAARETSAQSNNFKVLQKFSIDRNSSIASELGTARFNDDNASNKLGVETRFYTYSFNQTGKEDFVVLRYDFYNTTDQEITNFYAGLFTDWDIDENDWEGDTVNYDVADNFAFIKDAEDSPTSDIVGMALISGTEFGYYGIDNNASGQISMYDANGFSKSEKWTTLSNGVTETAAGPTDVSAVISAGPYSIPADSKVTVAFALAAGEDMNSLRAAIQESRSTYNSIILPTSVDENELEIPNKFTLEQNYPNPFNPATSIEFSVPSNEYVSLKVFDILGREVITLVNEQKSAGRYQISFDASDLSSGIYIYRLNAGAHTAIKKMMLLK
ncbi:MAG: S8 family peptidase [Melioribacteraceae bacterium]|nr:S8 family peptidase [Melioribacteraceae bacterium]